jgi:nucleotide-binding universal stress UspA family protein
MIEYQPILVTLDGSELAEAALPYAEALGGIFNASLHLVAVVERESGGPFAPASEIRAQLAQWQVEGTKEYLATIARKVASHGVVAETETVETSSGHADEEILAAAARSAAGTIVMATHGRGGMQRLILGSVADKVMRAAKLPTLLVSPSEDQLTRGAVKLRVVAVPLDGSPFAEGAFAPAAAIAAAAGAELLLVRVESPLLTTTAAYPYVPDLQAVEAQLMREARQYLEGVQERLPSTIQSDVAVLRGAPAVTMAGYLQEKAVDLVVMSTHGRGGFRRFSLGSTADRLVRVGMPVLLIRPAQGVSGVA